ncbi:hypothetical protein J0H58_34330 [bacterium]|nr:hypothetical protein [bacterium]
MTYGTVHTWLTVGVKTHAGRLKLPALKVGGVWRIDPAGVESFLQKLTTSARGEEADPTPPPESATRRRARAQAAMDRLREMGVIA